MATKSDFLVRAGLTVATNTVTIGTSAYFVANGNVGIGTSTPITKLHVAGTTNVYGSSNNNFISTFNNTGGTNSYGVLIDGNGSGYALAVRDASNQYRFRFGGDGTAGMGGPTGAALNIDSIGNILIGAADAGNTLRYFDVQNANTGSSAGAIMRFITANVAGTGVTTVDVVKYKSGGFIINNNETNTAAFTAFNVGASERMRIDSSGKALIGLTASKTYGTTLQVQGGIQNFGASSASVSDIIAYDYNSVDASPTYAGAVLRKYGSTATGNLYVATTVAAAGWAEVSGINSNGLGIGTNAASPIIFGTSAAERMRIDAGGNTGIGTTTPGYKLEVNGYVASSGLKQLRQDTASEGGQIEICAANNNAVAWNIDAFGSTTTPALRVFNASAVGVTLVSGATAWTTYSDINLKTDLQPIEDAIDTLKDIRCVTYRFKDIDEPDSKRRIGIIAQDIVGKVDEALDHAQMKGDPNDYLSVRYTELVPHLIKAIQELSAEVTALKAKLA